MNYEEKYNQALERAKKVHDGELTISQDEVNNFNVYEYIFPELCESEDERIRKEIIQSIKDNMCVIHKEKCLAWLEKQGENKPTDKAEPKFKVGDWIVQNGLGTYKIVEVCESWYEVISYNDGIQYSIGFDKENGCHLWTIQDAKDGDVLSFNDGHGNDSIELIKSITGKKIEFWFCLTNGNSYEVFDGITPYTNLVSREDATPATKEQCDILLQKMKESGYEWNVEKKELNKIEKQGEQKPTPKFKIGDTIHKIGENTVFPMTIEKIEDGDYVCNNSHSFVNIKFQDYYELVEQKPSWSEEDEKMLNKIIDELTPYGECPDYPSPEEQEYYYTRQEMIDWLKSIKPQNRWKPSEEQMEALETAIRCRTMPWEQLGTLYNNLKNL